MNVRIKSRRRLINLLSVVFLVLAIGTGVYFVRMRQIAARAQRALVAGRAALAERRYNDALQGIGLYIQQNDTDPDVLYDYGLAREHVELPGHKHLINAASFYNRVLSIRPDDDRARHALLDVYLRCGFIAESQTIANEILVTNKKDLPALRAKVAVLYSQHNLDAAAKAADEYDAMVPLDLEIRVLWLDLLVKRGRTAQMLSEVRALAAQHVGDPRVELLQAIACGSVAVEQVQADQRAKYEKDALEWLHKAAAHPSSDPMLVGQLVGLLEGRGFFEESLGVLQRSAMSGGGSGNDPVLRREYAGRLWQAGRGTQVLELLKDLDAADPNTDSELLGIRAMAAAAAGRTREAESIAVALRARQGDRNAAAWAAALPMLSPLSTASDAQMLRVMVEDVLSLAPDNPYFKVRLGDVYARLGETEAAIQQWQEVTLPGPGQRPVAPAWAGPLVKASQALITRAGREIEGIVDAREATRRAPGDLEAMVNLALVENLQVRSAADAKAVGWAETLKAVRELNPAEERTMAAEIRLQCLIEGPKQASEHLTALLGRDKPLSETTLLTLALVSNRLKLGLEDKCFEVCFARYGVTPNSALAKANWYRDSGKPDEALRYLDNAVKAGSEAAPMRWRRAWAQFLDSVQDPRGAAAWASLAHDFPKDIELQWAMLASSAARADRALATKTIDRLAELIGRDTPEVRAYKAIWLMGGGGQQELRDASTALTDVVRQTPHFIRARLALATCLEQLGNVTGAIDQLVTVANLRPGDPNVMIDLARLLQQQGDLVRAGQYLSPLARPEMLASLTLLQHRQVAELLAASGDVEGALRAVSATAGVSGSEPVAADKASALLEARLYRRLNMPEKASAILQTLLEKPDPEIVDLAVDFYLSVGREADARAALARLDASSAAAPAEREMAWGRFYRLINDVPHTLEAFTKASKAAPADVRIWRALALYGLESGRAAEAIDAATHAVKQAGGGGEFTAITENAALITSLSSDAAIRPLMMAILVPTGGQDASADVVAALKILGTTDRTRALGDGVLKPLRVIADRNTKVMALQIYLARAYLIARTPDEAVAVATRAEDSFPNEAAPFRIAAQAFLIAGRWTDAETAARKWRERAPSEALPADLTIAESLYNGAVADTTRVNILQLNRAAELLRPYLDRAHAAADVEENFAILATFAECRLAVGGYTEMLPLLQRHLSAAPYRGLLRTLAKTKGLPSPVAAEWLTMSSNVTPPDSLAEAAETAEVWVSVASADPSRKNDARAALVRATTLAQGKSAAAPSQQILTVLAILLEQVGDVDHAEAAYRQLLASNPHNAVAANNLAMILSRRKANLDEAIAMMSRVIAENGGNPNYYDTMANVLVAKNSLVDAAEYLRKAVASDPRRAIWQMNLASVLLRGGRSAEAKVALDKLEASGLESQLSERDRTDLVKMRATVATRADGSARSAADVVPIR